MKKIKRLKYISTIVVVVLGISLIMNVYLVSKVSELGDQVTQVMLEQQYLSSELSGQTGNIMSVLDEFQQQQSWLGSIDIEASSASAGEGELTFKWLVKELEEESDVLLNYTSANDEQYTSIPAVELEQGLFETTIPFESGLGPVWEPTGVYGLTNVVEEYDDGQNYELKEEQYESTAINYYISVLKDDGSYKNGDLETVYLQDFSSQLYGYVQTGVYLEDKEFQVYLHHNRGDGSDRVIEHVYLLKYQQDELIEEEELELIGKGPWQSSFEKNNITNYDDMKLVLKVIYANGDTFEKEILNEN